MTEDRAEVVRVGLAGERTSVSAARRLLRSSAALMSPADLATAELLLSMLVTTTSTQARRWR